MWDISFDGEGFRKNHGMGGVPLIPPSSILWETLYNVLFTMPYFLICLTINNETNNVMKNDGKET